MRHKSHVTGNKMSVTDISDPIFVGKSAKRMARDLLTKEFRGPGDNIETAAYRVQSTYGVDANIIMQGWNRPPREMMATRWLSLFQAWCAAGFARAEKNYDEERAKHEDHSALVRLADLVAGKAARKEALK